MINHFEEDFEPQRDITQNNKLPPYLKTDCGTVVTDKIVGIIPSGSSNCYTLDTVGNRYYYICSSHNSKQYDQITNFIRNL